MVKIQPTYARNGQGIKSTESVNLNVYSSSEIALNLRKAGILAHTIAWGSLKMLFSVKKASPQSPNAGWLCLCEEGRT